MENFIFVQGAEMFSSLLCAVISFVTASILRGVVLRLLVRHFMRLNYHNNSRHLLVQIQQ